MLIFDDGTPFEGVSVGAEGTRTDMIMLYTGVVGYQEVMTDPANAGKIIVFTYPLLGNYGINPLFNESKRAWCSGIVFKEKSRTISNFQALSSLEKFLKSQGIIALSEVDTRTLTVTIRDSGEQTVTISSKAAPKTTRSKQKSFLKDISVSDITQVCKGKGPKIAVLDIGITNSILKQFELLDFNVWVFPYNAKPQDIVKIKPDGVIISNGPEEDEGLDKSVVTVEGLLGKIPMLGIGTGHVVIARAIGAKIVPLKLGHRGANYPVMTRDSLKGEITVQNHRLVVEESSLKGKKIAVIERNLNDKTIEKMQSDSLQFVSIQYYPASSLRCNETHPIFEEFLSQSLLCKK
jgi:carbamoyl-phosphate synthase small subunit